MKSVMFKRWNIGCILAACSIAASGCSESGPAIYAPSAILNDGTTLALTAPAGQTKAQLALVSPVAWNDTVLIVNGNTVDLTEPIPDGKTLRLVGGYVFRHAARITSRTQVTVPADAFVAAGGSHYDITKEPPRSLDAFYRTTDGEYVHWRAPLVKVPQ